MAKKRIQSFVVAKKRIQSFVAPKKWIQAFVATQKRSQALVASKNKAQAFVAVEKTMIFNEFRKFFMIAMDIPWFSMMSHSFSVFLARTACVMVEYSMTINEDERP